MRVVVASCWAYRDAWDAFFPLFKKFWPDCPYPVHLITDLQPLEDRSNRGWTPDWCWVSVSKKNSGWCEALAKFLESELLATDGQPKDAPVLLFQEDFLLNAPVNQSLIEHGLEILKRDNVGAVRLYPCPGGAETNEDPYFGRVARHTMYRTSCQSTIWRPEYLHAIASRFNTPSEFELQGSPWASQHLPAEVWAFKRSVQPWPIQYYCSAISRALWEPDALEFCRQQGIHVDTSLRGIRKTESDVAVAAS